MKKQVIVVGASEPGTSHVTIPCQDAHAISKISDGCGVAICCDGAGSRSNSHHGAEFVASALANSLKNVVISKGWISPETTPSPGEWRDVCTSVIQVTASELQRFSESTGYSIDSLACTVIALVYSNHALLVAHIGNGRGGYKNAAGEWTQFLAPVSGPEAEMTEFITSRDIEDLDEIINSHVIIDDVKAFAIVSDGLEHDMFETGGRDENMRFVNKNKPHKERLDFLVGVLLEQDALGAKDEDLTNWVSKFIRDGAKRFIDQPDDKTIILGAFVD